MKENKKDGIASGDTPVKPWFIGRRNCVLVIAAAFIFFFGTTLYLLYEQNRGSTERAVKEDRETANLISLVLEEHFQRIVKTMESYSHRPLLLRAVMHKDVKNTTEHLVSLSKNDPDIHSLAITDRAGILWAVYPSHPEMIGKSLAYRDWYKGVSRTWEPYISNAVQRLVGEKDIAVQICVPFYNDRREVIGLFLNTQRTVKLGEIIGRIALDPGTYVHVTDRKGQLIYSTRFSYEKEIKQFPFFRIKERAISSKKPTLAVEDPALGGRTLYISYAPIADIGWSVFIGRDSRAIWMSDMGRSIQTAAVVFLIFLMIALALFYLRKRVMADQAMEQLRAEKELQMSEVRFRTILDQAADIILVHDMQGRFVDVNQEACRELGYTREELLDLSVSDIDPEAIASGKNALWDQLVAGQRFTFESNQKRKDGTSYPVEVNLGSIILDREKLIIGIVRNISERRRAEERQHFVHRILETLNSPNEVINLVRNILLLIKEHTEIEAIGIRLREGDDFPYYETNGFPPHFIDAERSLCARDPNNEVIRDSRGNPHLECMCGKVIRGRTDPSLPFFTKGGSFWTNKRSELLGTASAEDLQARTRNSCEAEGYESVVLIPLRSGEEIIGLLQMNDKRADRFTLQMIEFFEGIGASIGIAIQRRQAAEAIRVSEKKYRELVENAQEGIYQSTPEGKFVSVNSALARMLGYNSPEELIGSVTDIGGELYVDPGQRARVVRILDEQCFISAYEVQLYRKDRSVMWLSLNARAVKDEKGNLLYIEGMAEDITERKQAEEDLLNTLNQLQDAKDMLVRSEKLAAVGQLSAGVAHEILNPINIIGMKLQLLEIREPLSEKIKEEFKICQEQIKRITRITKDLQQFGRISDRKTAPSDIHELMEEVLSLAGPRLKVEDVKMDTRYQADLPPVPLDRERMGQVILNLINNALDAMKDRPVRTLQVSTAFTGENGVRLSFSDTGTGIPEEVLPRIFDPFFTTKEPGKGTGLGLSIVYGIIQDHGGRIWAENNDEGGATFFVELPV